MAKPYYFCIRCWQYVHQPGCDRELLRIKVEFECNTIAWWFRYKEGMIE